MGNTRWSEVEDRYIKIYFPKYGTKVCGRLKRSPAAVADRAHALSVHARDKRYELAGDDVTEEMINNMSVDDYIEMNRMGIKSMSFRYTEERKGRRPNFLRDDKYGIRNKRK